MINKKRKSGNKDSGDKWGMEDEISNLQRAVREVEEKPEKSYQNNRKGKALRWNWKRGRKDVQNGQLLKSYFSFHNLEGIGNAWKSSFNMI